MPEAETGELATTKMTPPTGTGSTEITRFNTLRHGILSPLHRPAVGECQRINYPGVMNYLVRFEIPAIPFLLCGARKRQQKVALSSGLWRFPPL
jgi:hypothetical protein